jgi:FkbM family methyltransferase
MNFSELKLLDIFFKSKTKGVLIDVGAHHGVVSGVFAKKGWQILAFEPEEKNRASLQKNLTDFEKVKIIPKAVSDENNVKIPFYVSNKHYGIHSIKPFHETHELAYEVETTTLNSALEKEKINEVAFLKIDTEGADFLALKGFDVEKYKPEIMMLEFMDDRSMKNFGYTHHDVVNYMKSSNYVCYVSEWEPIKQYGIEGVQGEPHTWIQCKEYPLNHEPSWGNLIFIKKNKLKDFKKALNYYLNILMGNMSYQSRLRIIAKKIPGFKLLYHIIKRK